MKGIFQPLLAALESKGYPVTEYYDGDFFTEDILVLCEYKTPFLKFGPIKNTKEKNVGKFLINDAAIAIKFEKDDSEVRKYDSDELLEANGPKAAAKQFLGMLLNFNQHHTDACPVRIEGLNQRWYFESEIVTMDNGNLEYKLLINCPSADPQNEQRFNAYGYYEDLWKIAKMIHEGVNDLLENVRFMKMY